MEKKKISIKGAEGSSSGRLCYFVCGAPGVGKSTQQHMQLTKFGGTPADWEKTQQMSDNFKGETSQVDIYTTHQYDPKQENPKEEDKIEFSVLDCPGLTGPKGDPEELSKKLTQVCEVNNIRLNGMMFMNKLDDLRQNAVNQLMAKLAPAILESQQEFWSQSLFIATQCNRVTDPTELEKKKKIFIEMIKSEELVGENGAKVKDTNIIFALRELEGSGFVERLLEIAKTKLSYGQPRIVKVEEVINMVAKVNGVDLEDSEGMKKIRIDLAQKKKQHAAEREQLMKDFDSKMAVEKKQNEKHLSKIESEHKKNRDELNAKNLEVTSNLEKKNEAIREQMETERRETQKQIDETKRQMNVETNRLKKEQEAIIIKADKDQNTLKKKNDEIVKETKEFQKKQEKETELQREEYAKREKNLERQLKQQEKENKKREAENKRRMNGLEFDVRYYTGIRRSGFTHFDGYYDDYDIARKDLADDKWAGNAVCIVKGNGSMAFSDIDYGTGAVIATIFAFGIPAAGINSHKREALAKCCSETKAYVSAKRANFIDRE